MSPDAKLDMLAVMKIWMQIQVNLESVIRWKKYMAAASGACRTQNSLQHSYSIALLGSIILPKLAAAHPLDTGLVMLALLLHDVGEGELGEDTDYLDKTASKDLKEYESFSRLTEKLDPEVRMRWTDAFLLQFALKCPPEFPAEEHASMKYIAETRRLECLAFDAIERYDYVLYAREQLELHQSPTCLVWTLRNQLPHLRRLALELPGFNTVWHDDLDKWAAQTLDSYSDVEEEKKAG